MGKITTYIIIIKGRKGKDYLTTIIFTAVTNILVMAEDGIARKSGSSGIIKQ